MVDRRSAPAGEAAHGRGMARRRLHLIQAIVFHAALLVGLDHGDEGLGATARATEGPGAVIDPEQAGEPQPGVTPAGVAAHPHRTKCLVQRADGVGFMGPGFGHDGR
jgi:hypothetical protein